MNEKKKIIKKKKGSRSMKTLFRIERGSNNMLEEALDKLDECIDECILKKKLVKEQAK